VPVEATAPALVIVGIQMMQGIAELELKDFVEAVPCILTIVLMPLTFSISEGLALGFVFYCALMLFAGRARKVTPTGWVPGAIFLIHLLVR
jgi:AGZA family xanthine/uracil permease-like MFS transporter